MQANNGPPLKPAVIVRAWGDEPVKLFLHRIENRRCYVGKLESHTPIGLPDDQVFIFDVDRFHMLSSVFQQGDGDKLGELWANIPMDDFACNRYQNDLDYRHDQESVSSTRSTQECVGR